MNLWLDKKVLEMRTKLLKIMADETGDTNFISILILLSIAVILAGVFIGFKDTIVGQVQGYVDGFTIH